MGTTLGWQPPLTAFLVTSLLDMLSTHLALEVGLAESNSLPALLLETGGPELMFLAKGLSVLLVVVFVIRLSPFFPRLWHGLRLANWFLGLVVLSNTLQALAA